MTTTFTIPGEIWRTVIDYDGIYEVSNFAQVRSIDRVVPHPNGYLTLRGRSLKQAVGTHGYFHVVLSNNGKSTTYTVHRLVAAAFLGVCPPYLEVQHLDGNRRNNVLSNIGYGTHSESQFNRVKHGTDTLGEKNTSAKLTESSVFDIRRAIVSGRTIAHVAKDYGVTYRTVSNVVKRKTWSHVI